MKNLIIALVLTIALSVYFSCFGYCPAETTKQNGFGTQHKGDSGLIIPGDGELLADTVIEPESMPERSEHERTDEAEVNEVAEASEETTEETSEETSEEIHTEILTKEKNKMGGMLISFWHGVAAVLIGETSALMVAIAWMKIRGGKDE